MNQEAETERRGLLQTEALSRMVVVPCCVCGSAWGTRRAIAHRAMDPQGSSRPVNVIMTDGLCIPCWSWYLAMVESHKVSLKITR